MKNKDKQFSLGDIFDILLTIGCVALMLNFAVFIPDAVVDLTLVTSLSSVAVASLGIGRFFLRRKQKKIDELEEILAQHAPELLSSQKTSKPTRSSQLIAATDDLEIRFLEELTLQKGRITLTEAVVLLRVAIDKLLPVIERLQHKGIIGAEVSDSGQIIYVNMA